MKVSTLTRASKQVLQVSLVAQALLLGVYVSERSRELVNNSMPIISKILQEATVYICIYTHIHVCVSIRTHMYMCVYVVYVPVRYFENYCL